MTDVETVVTDFAATGRTGRRNAVPDILGSNTGPEAADLPNKLADLAVGDDAEHGGEGSSSSSDAAKDPAEGKDQAEGT
ncbi:cAMP-dependent protein kinase inhibitor beta [Ictalurus punctatus]|uniref:cAMP-dependent protein kinase inhibitor beta n=1 Tax=Ictalurus punctatus TaxID=7998 RepID=A0A9F7RAZ2_ICTPU|nr:cAMP-dependent protein kinase inhibitor beta [Ictalurus furcatus]XP_053469763.1 cAMP-dependent protein kinase inhibitor beta [Ictalurus furcatus]XP_053531878.1 cAMP-dependent protein kinase inhibitor beta [Ictalurus punctatus]